MALDKQALRSLTYDFFFAFSRMEFALKERRLLESAKLEAKAKPGWNAFVDRFEADYVQSAEGRELIEARPKCQFVGPDKSLEWRDLEANPNRSELGNTVDALHVVRNNLFHGGKHGEKSWDDPERTGCLLTLGLVVLRQLANLHEDIRADFLDEY